MVKIGIDGHIGWETTLADVRRQLKEASGDDVELVVNSPGGSIYQGAAIFNEIRDYRRQGGRVSARVAGLAASMSSYIPLSAETVEVEDNAVFMIHNPRSIAWGDQSTMKKAADHLESLAALLASRYVLKTGKPLAEIRRLMDEETFFYGEEIVDAGFADSLIPSQEGAESKGEAVAFAALEVSDMEERMHREADMKKDTEKAVALLGDEPALPQAKKPLVIKIEDESKETKMTLQILKRDHPDIHALAMAEGVAEGVAQGVSEERERVLALLTHREDDPGNREVEKVVAAAIADGTAAEAVIPKITRAIRDGKPRRDDGENPPLVRTAADAPALSEEDHAAAKMAGMSADEYRRYMRKETE